MIERNPLELLVYDYPDWYLPVRGAVSTLCITNAPNRVAERYLPIDPDHFSVAIIQHVGILPLVIAVGPVDLLGNTQVITGGSAPEISFLTLFTRAGMSNILTQYYIDDGIPQSEISISEPLSSGMDSQPFGGSIRKSDFIMPGAEQTGILVVCPGWTMKGDKRRDPPISGIWFPSNLS